MTRMLGGPAAMDPEPEPSRASEPPIEVELLKREPRQICTAVRRVDGGIEIEAASRTSRYRTLAALRCVHGDQASPLYHRKSSASEDITYYRVYVPTALLNENLRFEALDRSGEVTPVFTAGTRRIKLPRNWMFSRYHLALELSLEGKPAVGEDAIRCFVRSITVEDRRLRLDCSIFFPRAMREDDHPAVIEISRGPNDTTPLREPAALLPARRVFRIPAAMHRHYAGLDAVHVAADLAVDAIFDDADLYDLHVLFVDQRLPLFPYNAYYAEKPASFALDDGVNNHLVRHFADPVTGSVRLAYR